MLLKDQSHEPSNKNSQTLVAIQYRPILNILLWVSSEPNRVVSGGLLQFIGGPTLALHWVDVYYRER